APSMPEQFQFTTIDAIKVHQPETYKPEQATYSFDLPILEEKKAPQENALFNLTDETRNIQVKEAVEVVPMTEVNKDGVVRYSLEEYMELENDLLNSKPTPAKVEEQIPAELNLTVKKVDVPSSFTAAFEEVSPMEMTIEETLKFRADERRKKLKDFNYKFHNSNSRIEEFEKQPAYKRSGVDLTSGQVRNGNSRMSLGIDSNDDVQLRSNNSYLHDNVD